MPGLQVKIDADCSGLIAALDASNAKIDETAGRSAGVAIVLSGADNAIRGLAQVGQARENAGGVVTLGVNSSGIAVAREQLGGLRQDVRAASREFEAAGGIRAFGFSDNGSIRQLTADLGGATRATTALASEGGQISRVSVGIQSTGSAVRELDANMSSAARTAVNLGGATSQVEQNVSQLGRSAEAMGTKISVALDSSAASLRGTQAAGGLVTQEMKAMATAGVAASGGLDATAVSAVRADTALASVGAQTSAVTSATQKASQALSGSASGGGSGGLLGDLNAVNNAVGTGSGPATPSRGGRPGAGSLDSASRTARRDAVNPPPPVDPPGLGGPFGEGGAFNNKATKAGGLLDTGLENVGKFAGMISVMGAAVGAMEALAPAAVGLMAVNAVVKDTPALSYAAGKAQAQMADGIRQGAAGATGIGVPAYQKLGAALHSLGEEVGHIGVANLGQVLGAETSLSGSLTSALKQLEPTISPAIKAAESLGTAFLNGIANPSVATAITATSNALATPGVADAVEGIVHTIATVAPYLATGATQVIADLAGHGAGASNVGTGILTQPVGETVAEHSGGLFHYDPATDAGLPASAPLPGGASGVSWNQNTMLGTGMTALGSEAHLAGVLARDAVTGSGYTNAATQAAWADTQQRMGRALTPGGANLPDPGGPQPAGPDQLAAAQKAAPFGYDQVGGPGGSLTPSLSPGGGGGWYPGGPGTGGLPAYTAPPGYQPATPPPGAPPLMFGGVTGGAGPGSSVGVLSQSDRAGLAGAIPSGLQPTAPAPTTQVAPSAAPVTALSAALPSATAALNSYGAAGSTAASGAQATTQHTTAAASAMTTLNTTATAAAAPVQQAVQHTQTATSAVTALAQQAPAAVAQVQQIAPAAHAALIQAAPAVASAGANLGGTATTAIASGITANQSQACDASSQLAKSTAACASATLAAHSPSQVFRTLGEGTGQGLALGIQSSTGQAVGAVRGAMGDVIGAGAQTLGAHSPSTEFEDLGLAITSGLKVGALSGADTLVSTMARITQQTQASHENAWNPDPLKLPGVTTPAAAPPHPATPPPPPATPPPPPMTALNTTLAGQNTAAMPPALVAQYQQQQQATADASKPQTPDEALRAALAKQTWTAATQDTVAKYLEAKQAIQDKNNLTEDTQQLAAMKAAGIKVDPIQGKNTMQAYKALQMNEHTTAQTLASKAAAQGITPAAVKQNQVNAALGMGPTDAAPGTKYGGVDAGAPPKPHAPGEAHSPSPSSGVGPAGGKKKHGTPMGEWGDPAAGNNAIGKGENAVNRGSNATNFPDATQGGKAGGEFAGGFAGGIAAGTPAAQSAAAGMGTLSAGELAKILLIRSPSRVTMGHGMETSEGFARGIRDNRGPRDAMREMVRDAMDGGRGEWDKGWGDMSPWGLSHGMGGSSSGGSSGGSSSGSGGGLGGPWGRSHGWPGRHHHGDRDEHEHGERGEHEGHGGRGGGEGRGEGREGGREGMDDRLAERFADRLSDRMGGGGFGHGGGEGRGEGHRGRGDHDGERGEHGDRDHWLYGGGFGSGSGSGSGSGGGGTPPYTGMNPWWAEHPGGRGWGDHDDHDRDRDRHRDRDRDDHRGRGHERHHDHDRDDDHERVSAFNHLAADNMPEIRNQSHEMGAAVSQGMTQGIQQNAAQVTQAASLLAQAAVATVRSSLGIASPSKVFFQIGGDAVKGFSHGLTSGVQVMAENGKSLGQITALQMQEGLKTGEVNQGYSIGLNRWLSGLKVQPNFMPFSDWLFDEKMVGGFASSVQAGADGAKSIADSSGLMVGSVWARSVVTGLDTVLQTNAVSALTSPAIGSALATTALGTAGLLAPAGSGAETYNTTGGNAGMVTMGSSNASAPPVHVHVHVDLDGQPFDNKVMTAIVQNNDQLVNAILSQRG